MTEDARPPVPPFTEETARQKVQAAEDAWNTCEPERVALAYTVDSKWRNRDEFFEGREAIVEFLRRKWARERDYRLRKELWSFTDNRISVRFEYESRDPTASGGGATATSTGFDERGYMRRRDASINDYRSRSTSGGSTSIVLGHSGRLHLSALRPPGALRSGRDLRARRRCRGRRAVASPTRRGSRPPSSPNSQYSMPCSTSSSCSRVRAARCSSSLIGLAGAYPADPNALSPIYQAGPVSVCGRPEA